MCNKQLTYTKIIMLMHMLSINNHLLIQWMQLKVKGL